MAAHRYWRVLIDKVNGSTYANCAELGLYAAASSTSLGTNKATGGTASASSVYNGSYTAAHAFDGNATTFWLSLTNGLDAVDEWLKYDLGAGNEADINYFTWKHRNDSNLPAHSLKDFYLQYSDNDADWTTVISRTNEPQWAQGEERAFTDFPAQNARVSQVTTEVLRTNTAVKARVSQVAVEVLRFYPPVLSVSQVNARVVSAGNPNLRASQLSVRVVSSVALQALNARRVVFIN